MKKYKTKVYLLKVETPDNRLYKIGTTKNTITSRIKGLQTGCPYEIECINYFETEYGQMVERALHNHYGYSRTFGEWFKLDLQDEFNFIEKCEMLENVNIILEKNKSN